MNEENRQLNITTELEKAKNCTSQAQVLLDKNFYDGAISRAYYAIFHYAKALLLSQGFEPKTHTGLVHLFKRGQGLTVDRLTCPLSSLDPFFSPVMS